MIRQLVTVAWLCFGGFCLMQGMLQTNQLVSEPFYVRFSNKNALCAALHEAILNNNSKKIKELIAQCDDKDKSSVYTVEVFEYCLVDGGTYLPFYYAVKAIMENKVESLKALFACGSSPHITISEFNKNNLFCFAPTKTMVELLIQYGVNVKHFNARNRLPFEAWLLQAEFEAKNKTTAKIVELLLPIVKPIPCLAMMRLRVLLKEAKDFMNQKKKQSLIAVAKELIFLLQQDVSLPFGSRILKTNQLCDIFFE